MSSRLGIAVAITIVVVFLSVLGAYILRDTVDNVKAEPEPGSGVAAALADARPAQKPFVGLTEAQLALADKCLLVAIADQDAERVEGLRDALDLGPYDGMIFVYDEDTSARFTMANTPLPLDIGFYDAAGALINRLRMEPCPQGTDATCPTYRPTDPTATRSRSPPAPVPRARSGPARPEHATPGSCRTVRVGCAAIGRSRSVAPAIGWRGPLLLASPGSTTEFFCPSAPEYSGCRGGPAARGRGPKEVQADADRHEAVRGHDHPRRRPGRGDDPGCR